MAVLREWLSQIVCYLCLTTLLLHVIPDTGMKRYVRFFFWKFIYFGVGGAAGGDIFGGNLSGKL